MTDITHQLVDQVRSAYDSDCALKIVGANSKGFLGRETQGQALEVAGHSGIIAYQPVELVLTARAGTPLVEIEKVLAENNQMLSFEPPTFTGKATLGGTYATNLSGPARPWSGSIRDMVLGVKLINGRGELLNFGGQVMKNVAGYDVSRAQAGALGSLGVMTEISLKVMPKLEAECSLVLDIAQSDAITMMNKLAATAKPIYSASWYREKLYIRLSGAASSVEQCTKLWSVDYGFSIFEEGPQFWQSLREYRHPFFHSDKPLWRFSVNSNAKELAVTGDTLLDWGGAQRWVSGEQELSQMQNIAQDASGTVALWRGGDRQGEVNHRQNIAMQCLQQRVMRSLDPKNILNPARLYSWL